MIGMCVRGYHIRDYSLRGALCPEKVAGRGSTEGKPMFPLIFQIDALERTADPERTVEAEKTEGIRQDIGPYSSSDGGWLPESSTTMVLIKRTG